MNDLRSAISKEVCKLICLASKICQEKIEILCERLISKECLFKVINSGNKVISENGHECILCLIENVKNIKIIPKIIDEFSSKNQIFRNKIAQYLNKILEIFHSTILEKYQNLIEIAFISTVSDANKDTRIIMRQCFKLYGQMFPIKADKLVIKFDIPIQKAMIEEGIINHDLSLIKYKKEGVINQIESRNFGKTLQASKNMNDSRVSKQKNDIMINRGVDEVSEDLDDNKFIEKKNSRSTSSIKMNPKANITPLKMNPNKMKNSDKKTSQNTIVYASQNDKDFNSGNVNVGMKNNQIENNGYDVDMMEIEDNFSMGAKKKSNYLTKVILIYLTDDFTIHRKMLIT